VFLADETPTLRFQVDSRVCAVASASPVSLVSGTQLCSRYVLEELIGCGGMSLVFRARDLHGALSEDGVPIPIAIKTLRPEFCGNPWAVAGLEREFRQMRRLSHPNIARVFDLCRDGDVWFITMQLLEGPTAKAWGATSHEPEVALRIIDGCCAALEHAHARGIVHGDLKPTNVIVAEYGTAIVIDFGSLPEAGGPFPVAGHRDSIATPAYASPQILIGREGEERDDVFGVACLSYALLTGGGHPFGGRPAYENGRIKSAPTYDHRLAPEVFSVLERGLSGERDGRHASISEFRLKLAAAGTVGRPAISSLSRGGSIRLDAPPAADGHLAEGPGTALVPWTATPKVGGRSSWRTTIRAPLVVLGFAFGAIALFLRLGTTGTDGQANVTAAANPNSNSNAKAMRSPSSASDNESVAAALSPPVVAARPLAQANGVVSFTTTTIRAAAEQSVLAIALRRSGRTANRGAYRWRVTTHGAGAGHEFAGARTGLDRFNEGQAVRTLFIPLIKDPGSPSGGPRNFSVILEPVAGGSALGRPASITVAIDPPARAGALIANDLPASR
jgi:serine/threonine protein kinase